MFTLSRCLGGKLARNSSNSFEVYDGAIYGKSESGGLCLPPGCPCASFLMPLP